MPDKDEKLVEQLSQLDLELNDEDEDDEDQPYMMVGPVTIQKNTFKNATVKDNLGFNPKSKKVANKAKTALQLGTTGTTSLVNMTGGHAGLTALIGGATLGAGPIGLLVASAALTLASSTSKVISAKKTHDHIKGLQKIQLNASSYGCKSKSKNNHNYIIETALPYIIAKKTKKRTRKLGGSVPIIGSNLETARSAIKSVIKRARRTRGKSRYLNAQKIAEHHTETRCELTAAIIAELFGISMDDAAETFTIDTEQLATVLSIKMRSV